MYRVMIVDDEPIVRLSIKTIADWQKYGYEIAGEAANGLEAIENYKKNNGYDIILTDISMPKMGGIELIKSMLGINPNVPIIVLSAYNEYQFVREAFKLGAIDYILKSDLNPDSIIKLFNKAVQLLKEKNQTCEEQRIRSLFLKERLLESLLKGRVPKDVSSKANEYEVCISPRNITVSVFILDDYKLMEEKYDSVILENYNNSIKNIFLQKREEFKAGEFINTAPGTYVLITSFENDISIGKINQKLSVIIGSIRHALKEYLDISSTVGISDIMNEYDNIAVLYRQALDATALRFILGKGRIVFKSDIDKVPAPAEGKIYENIKGLFDALESMDKVRVEIEVQKVFNYISRLNIINIDKVYNLYLELIYYIVGYLNEKGLNIKDILGKDIDFVQRIRNFETLDEINNWVKNIIMYIFHELNEKNSTKSLKVKKALEYVKQHYMENISLRNVSEHVEVGESYLSRIFTKEVGENFITYLTRLRLNKAKELMKNTMLSISQISEQVGYDNLEHFSRVFKKNTGSSPNKFRNEPEHS